MLLSEIQARFKAMLLGEPANDIDGVLKGDELSGRLDVYRNNVMSNTSNAMTGTFPLLDKLVGHEFLDAMCRAYILQNPPTEGALTFYGSDFDEFVRTYPGTQDFPYLPDMARLEILANKSANARDDEPLSALDLSKLSAQELEMFHVELRDSVHLLQSEWPLEAIKNLCMNPDMEKAPDLKSGGVCLLIHRPQLEAEVIKLQEDQYAFLKNIQNHTLGAAVVKTLGAYPDFDFPQALSSFLALQIFVKRGDSA